MRMNFLFEYLTEPTMKRVLSIVVVLLCFLVANDAVAQVQEFAPFDYWVRRGVEVEFDLTNLEYSDDEYCLWNPTQAYHNSAEFPLVLFFDFLLDTDQPKQLFLQYETHCNTPNVFLSVTACDHLHGCYDLFVLYSEELSYDIDSVRTIDLTEHIDEIVAPGTGFISVGFHLREFGFTLVNPWEISIDEIVLSYSE